MKHKALLTLGAAALLAVGAVAPAGAAGPDLVINGGFESGDFTGWTTSLGPFSGIDAFAARSGDFGLFGGEVDVAGTLEQSLATAPGTVYEIRFWLRSDGLAPNEFRVGWGGDTLFAADGLEAFAYTEHVLRHAAAGPLTSLVFAVRNDNGFLELDDISVQAVPEPGGFAMFGAGLAALAWWRRRAAAGQPG